jgi:hypothetical protein
MKWNLSSWLVSWFVAALCAAPPGNAHDVTGVIVTHVDALSEQLATARKTATDAQTRSVLNNVLLWPVPRQLTICFLSGSPTLRGRVTEAMMRLWQLNQLTAGRLTFDPVSFSSRQDCGAAPSSDIRVDFKSKNGYWSYVGVQSRSYVPSMNLQDFTDAAPTGAEFDRLVGHETGHALGLEHEHQSPAAPVCGWDYAYLFSHYVWTSEEDMHANLDKLQNNVIGKNQHAYTFSFYDQSSLMHYYFEPQAFKNGNASPCYINAQANAPSQQDQNAVRIAYGSNLLTDQGSRHRQSLSRCSPNRNTLS